MLRDDKRGAMYGLFKQQPSLTDFRTMTSRKQSSLLVLLLLSVFALSPPLQGDMITTTFAANNGQAGNMFDINVLAADGILLEEIAVHLAGGDWDLEIYTRNGTYVGNETNSAAWTLHDSISGLSSSGLGTPTAWDIQDLSLDLGAQAFYVRVSNGTAMRYTNGTTEGSVFASNADLEILEGTGNAGLFGPQFRPRVWNGSLVYTVSSPVPEPGTVALLYGFFGMYVCRRKRR